jgi:hypothetical protein
MIVLVDNIPLSDILSTIETDVFLAQQFNGHVVDRVDLFLEDDGIKQRVDTCIALHESMLRNETGNAALTYTLRILGYHVVAHNLDVTAIAA